MSDAVAVPAAFVADTEMVAGTPVFPPYPCGVIGVELLVVVPFPSLPKKLSPQQVSAPLDSAAQAMVPRLESCVTPLVRPETCVGERLSVVVPSPS